MAVTSEAAKAAMANGAMGEYYAQAASNGGGSALGISGAPFTGASQMMGMGQFGAGQMAAAMQASNTAYRGEPVGGSAFEFRVEPSDDDDWIVKGRDTTKGGRSMVRVAHDAGQIGDMVQVIIAQIRLSEG